LILIEGGRRHSDSGFFVTLTGAFLALPCFAFSKGKHELKSWMQFIFSIGIFAPLAVFYNSTMMGFFTVLPLYGLLGFFVSASTLCYVIGFNDKDSLERSVVTSAILVVAFTLIKMIRIKSMFISPFVSAVNIMGCVTYFLGLLISSTAYHSATTTQYTKFQICMIGSLLIVTGVGSIWNIASLFNIGCTFAFFYVVDKIVEIPNLWKGGMVFVGIFASSIVLYFVSLFLHDHPGWVMSLFQAFD